MVDRAWIVSRKLGFHGKLSGVAGVGIDFHSGDRLSIAWSRSWNYLPTVRPITTARCSFHFLFPPPPPSPICFPVPFLPFLPFLFFSLFFPFVSPLLLARLPGRSRPSPLRLVLLCSFRKRCTTWRITWEILNFHAPRPRFFPFSLSSFSLSLSARPFGLKRHDCWLFLRHPVITDEQESNWKSTFHFARFVKIYRKLSIFRFLDRLSRYWFDINIIDRVDEIDFISVGK